MEKIYKKGLILSNNEEDLKDIPWVEKYRPQSLKDVISQTIAIQSLREFVKKNSLPHLIFTGPAGTGKTSAAVSLINDLIGKENITQDMILDRNASDDVRMATRDEIKNFVNHSAMGSSNNYKFVILDEADNIPSATQGAFRRIIEMAPPNVKFIFMCNYVEQIIDPILSRCAIFRFYPLPKKEFMNQISYIASKESISIEDAAIEAIYFISKGDMRKAINLFQMIVALMENEVGTLYKLDVDTIYEISGYLPPRIIEKIYFQCKHSKFLEVISLLKTINGFSSRGFFDQIQQQVLQDNYSHPKIEKIINRIAEYDYRLTLEADPIIQIDGFLADLIKIMEES